jgi:hypothetical protein
MYSKGEFKLAVLQQEVHTRASKKTVSQTACWTNPKITASDYRNDTWSHVRRDLPVSARVRDPDVVSCDMGPETNCKALHCEYKPKECITQTATS